MRYFYLLLITLLLSQCTDDAVSIGDSSNTGIGGSLARFTIVNDFLYTLEADRLLWFSLDNNGKMEQAGTLDLPEGKETIFPLDDLLFVGATDGLSIFQIDTDGTPALQGEVQHFVSCDPVVANEQYAYVTLRLEGCNGIFGAEPDRNVLNIYDVDDISNPNQIASYSMRAPRGLGLAGDYLFVCEGEFGLRSLDVSDPQDVHFLAFKEDIHANDVIVLPDVLLVIGPDNITQFDYSDPVNLVKLSEISYQP